MVTPKKIPYGLPPKKENGPFLYSYVDTPPDGGCHTIFGMIRPDEYTCFRLERRFGLTWWLVGLKLTDDDKKSALAKIEEIADRIERESNIEALLSAKGFQKSIAVMNDNGITVVVKSDGLTSAQTLQIQDIVTSETSIPLGNIKIVPIA